MSKDLSTKIHTGNTNCKNSNVRPVCPKCGGLLVPEIAFVGDGETRVVVSVGCVNCGERFYKEHRRRRAGGEDIKTGPVMARKAHRGVDKCCG